MVPLQAMLLVSFYLVAGCIFKAQVDVFGLPNFFLMTFRIFFWSNFLGSPCTVVKVLRPLRSVDRVSCGQPLDMSDSQDLRCIRIWM